MFKAADQKIMDEISSEIEILKQKYSDACAKLKVAPDNSGFSKALHQQKTDFEQRLKDKLDQIDEHMAEWNVESKKLDKLNLLLHTEYKVDWEDTLPTHIDFKKLQQVLEDAESVKKERLNLYKQNADQLNELISLLELNENEFERLMKHYEQELSQKIIDEQIENIGKVIIYVKKSLVQY